MGIDDQEKTTHTQFGTPDNAENVSTANPPECPPISTSIPKEPTPEANDETSKTEDTVKKTQRSKPVSNIRSVKQAFQKEKQDDINHQQNYDKVGGDVYNYFGLQGGIRKREVQAKDPEKEYDLTSPTAIIEFIQEHAASRILATAILLSLYEGVPLSDLYELSQSLRAYLPQHPDKEKQKTIDTGEIYVSQEGILRAIHGTFADIFNEHITVTIVVFENDSIPYLLREKIWTAFPSIREPIITWLISQALEKHGAQSDIAASALGKLMALDFSYGARYILPKIVNQIRPVRLLSFLLDQVSKSERLSDVTADLLDNWANDPSSILCRVPISCYCIRANTTASKSAETALKRIIGDIVLNGQVSAGHMSFLLAKMLQNSSLHILFAKALNEVYFEMQEAKPDRIDITPFFLNFSYECFLREDENAPELPIVWIQTESEDREQIIQYMRPIIKQIMDNGRYRLYFFAILDAYLSELDIYKCGFEPIKRFFRALAFTGRKRNQDEVFFMLIQKTDRIVPSITSAKLLIWLKEEEKRLKEVPKKQLYIC